MTSTIEALMTGNLMHVFNERDPARRLSVIRQTYTEDVKFLDPEDAVEGHDALSRKAQQILDRAPDFFFSPAGPVYVNHDMGYLAWHFGPENKPPVVSGVDMCFIEDGLIKSIYTLLL